MHATDLGFIDYDSYRKSPHWVGLQKKRKGQPCQRLFCSNGATVIHHLHYKTLGRERRKDYVFICHPCNTLAHFSDTNEKIQVTEKGEYLLIRWKEINSIWWNVKQFRPSYFFSWMYNAYKI